MMFGHPFAPKGMVINGCLFLTGVTMMLVGAHYSYANVERQQARTKARSDMLHNYLYKKYGYKKKWGNLVHPLDRKSDNLDK